MLQSVDAHLPAVEALMLDLAGEARGDFLGSIVAEHLNTGGKRLRARLALAALDAFGGAAENGVGWAAACEILHNATLIHDDLQDGDETRRGAPTTWVVHGMPQAVNAGDLLFLLPILALDSVVCDEAQKFRLSRAFAQRGAAVIRGQAAELSMMARKDTEPSTYQAAIAGKTSALFVLPVEGAAIIAGRDSTESVVEPFARLGALFQMQDDVLDLYGDKGRGSTGSDLREGKISGLVVEHLRLHPKDRAWLIELLECPRADTRQQDIDDAIAKFREHGALAAVRDQIDLHANKIRSAAIRDVYPRLADLLDELIDRVLSPIAHVW